MKRSDKSSNLQYAKNTSNTSSTRPVDSFLTFINQHAWDLQNRRTLLTVSGGVDSVVLAHLFHQNGFNAAIAHCNFGLRGEASELDESFVRQLATDFGFAFYTKRFDVKSYKEAHSVSTQMAARELRYQWFEEIREKNQFDWIATAHHINDSFETLLLNLVRGTNLRGLTGISAQNRYLIRPLLQTSREQILDYAAANNLQWREDESNESDDYSRNLIRHQVTPTLKKLNPSLEQTFVDTSERLAAANQVLDFFIQDWKKKHLRQENDRSVLPIQELSATVSPDYFLWSIVQALGFNYAQNKQIIKALSGTPGKLFLSQTHKILIDRQVLIVSKIQEQQETEIIIQDLSKTYHFDGRTLSFQLTEIKPAAPKINPEKNTAYLDASKIHLPLKLRKWKPGDKFAPLGMKGKFKKVSDLLTDLKLDRFEKEAVWLLENGNGGIIWVVGIRVDERFKVTAERHALVTTIIP